MYIVQIPTLYALMSMEKTVLPISCVARTSSPVSTSKRSQPLALNFPSIKPTSTRCRSGRRASRSFVPDTLVIYGGILVKNIPEATRRVRGRHPHEHQSPPFGQALNSLMKGFFLVYLFSSTLHRGVGSPDPYRFTRAQTNHPSPFAVRDSATTRKLSFR